MSADPFAQSLPDLIVAIRRDGTVLEHCGGLAVPALRPERDGTGLPCEQLWTDPLASLMRQLARKAITQRVPAEVEFESSGTEYEMRVSAQGPDRALCVIRAKLVATRETALETSGIQPPLQLDRRGFMRRFRESMAVAALREQAATVCVIQVDGVSDIAQVITPKVSEQLMNAAIQRLPIAGVAEGAKPGWYLGQLGDSLLALVFETGSRDAIEKIVTELCANLRAPVELGSSQFHLKPYAGVAILGQDASSPKLLLEHARAAAQEAQRRYAASPCFFSDTMQLQSLARLDIARELRDAIDHGSIRLNYRQRHDLASGRLMTLVGYLHWDHPFRGEIQPAEFLRVAETTGLATALSRRAFQCLREDAARLLTHTGPDVRLSFGALRNHVVQDDFFDEVAQLLESGVVTADRLELRISERTFVSRPAGEFNRLGQLGVRLVIDEVARGMNSLDSLARAPIWGLQLDRSWVAALCDDSVAQRVCHAGINMARSLGLTPIATGVDTEAQRSALLTLGCESGSGDLFPGTIHGVNAARENISGKARSAG